MAASKKPGKGERKPRKQNTKYRETIKAKYLAGATLKELADKYSKKGVTYSQIRNWAKRGKWAPERRNLTQKRTQKLKKRLIDSSERIARKFVSEERTWYEDLGKLTHDAIKKDKADARPPVHNYGKALNYAQANMYKSLGLMTGKGQNTKDDKKERSVIKKLTKCQTYDDFVDFYAENAEYIVSDWAKELVNNISTHLHKSAQLELNRKNTIPWKTFEETLDSVTRTVQEVLGKHPDLIKQFNESYFRKMDKILHDSQDPNKDE